MALPALSASVLAIRAAAGPGHSMRLTVGSGQCEPTQWYSPQPERHYQALTESRKVNGLNSKTVLLLVRTFRILQMATEQATLTADNLLEEEWAGGPP